MRPLTDAETTTLFEKLAHYIGKNLVHLIDRPDDPHVFRLHRDRVYYVSESNMRLAVSIARPNLMSLGTCFGKFSKTGKFRLHITALDYLVQYAQYKVGASGDWPWAKLTCAGVDQAQWRDALPLREPRGKGASRTHYGRHAGARRRGCAEHERGGPRLWRHGPLHHRYPKA